MKGATAGSDKEYQAEQDHRTMMASDEVMRDPKRSAAVKQKHAEKMAAMGHVGKTLGVKHTKAHPGFKAAQKNIEKKEGLSKESAGAILASAARNASKGAHKSNPRLNRVKG